MNRPIQPRVIIEGACQKIQAPPVNCSVKDFFIGEEKDDEQLGVRVKLYFHFFFKQFVYLIKYYTIQRYSAWCPAKKYVQLKMFIVEKVSYKFKQIFHGCKKISLSSFRSIYWLNVLEHYLL